MKVKQFSTLYVELIGATYLYTLPLAVQQYWSKIANATPLLLLDNVEHLLMTYSCSTSSQTLHTSLTISAVSALRVERVEAKEIALIATKFAVASVSLNCL